MEAVDVRGLLALLLVDGSLLPYRAPGGGYIQLTITAGVAESAYLDEKINEFRQFIPTKAKITPYKTQPRSNGKTTTVLRFRVSNSKLRPIYNLLYPSGERQITQTTLDLLGAQAAAWCWAEGARINEDGSSSLNRVGGSHSEAQLMANWLQMLTSAYCQIENDQIKPKLIFSIEDTAKIQKALIDYAPKTRLHLFTGEQWNASSIHSARTELLLGERKADTERQGENAGL